MKMAFMCQDNKTINTAMRLPGLTNGIFESRFARVKSIT